jgi:hypothetical protein
MFGYSTGVVGGGFCVGLLLEREEEEKEEMSMGLGDSSAAWKWSLFVDDVARCTGYIPCSAS